VLISSPSRVSPTRNSTIATQIVLDKANEALKKSFLLTGGSPSPKKHTTESFTTVYAQANTSGVARTYEILAKANEALKKSHLIQGREEFETGYARSPSKVDRLVDDVLRRSVEVRSRSPSPTKNYAPLTTLIKNDIRLTNEMRKSQEIVHALKKSQEIQYEMRKSQEIAHALQKSQEYTSALKRSQDLRAREALKKSQELRINEIIRGSRELPQDTLKKSQDLDRYYNVLRKSQEIQQAHYAMKKSGEYFGGGNSRKESAESFGSPKKTREAQVEDAYNSAMKRSQTILRKNADEMKKSGLSYIPTVQSISQLESPLHRSYVIEKVQGTPNQDIKNSPTFSTPKSELTTKYCEEVYQDGSQYKGDKVRDMKHGKGEMIYPDGRSYEGEWEYDRRNGYGVFKLADGRIVYDGEWKDDLFNGNGTLVNWDSNNGEVNYYDFDTLGNGWVKYDGEFMEGKKHGLGSLTLANNQRFAGKFRFDKVHGTGTFHKNNGSSVSGEWSNNQFVRAF
jgi:hypothetical protein